MFSKILSITGRPGLYTLISSNKKLNIVESLTDKKRIPVYAQEKVVALNDVSIYTTDGDITLREVLKRMKEKEGGRKISIGAKSGNELLSYLEEILPNYRRESVYASDVKKMIAWYNILIENGISFEEEEEEKGEKVGESQSQEEEEEEQGGGQGEENENERK